jgi:hypothetical protein
MWAIDNDWCERTGNEIARRKMPNAVHNVLEHDGFLRELSHIWGNQNKNSKWSFVFPVRQKRSNVRLSIQQGLFLCPMKSSMTFMDNLMSLAQRNEISKRIAKIVLKADVRFDGLYDLNNMNINRTTLFPGLDGFSQSLRNLALFSIVESVNRKSGGVHYSPFRSTALVQRLNKLGKTEEAIVQPL